jgi:HAE1 family hydrophobic/amphiphilic exporter-1
MGGITGRLYQQFAITIALSVLLSAVNALTLSPALAAMLLKKPTGKKTLLTPFYNGFNKVFGVATNGYISFTTVLVRKFVIGLVLIGVLSYLTGRPRGPNPRRVRAGRGPGLHPGERPAARQRVARADRRRDEEGRSHHGGEPRDRRLQRDLRVQPPDRRLLVEHGLLFRGAEGVEHRTTARAARQRCRRCAQPRVRAPDPEATVVAFGPPAIPGLGTGAGFTMQIRTASDATPATCPTRRRASFRRARAARDSDASRPCTAPACRRSTRISIGRRC